MKRVFWGALFPIVLFLSALSPVAPAAEPSATSAPQESSPAALLEQARALEAGGDWTKAKATLAQAAQLFPDEVQVAREQARLLDRSGDPGRRAAYERLIALLQAKGQDDRVPRRRLALLHLAAGDRQGALAASRGPAAGSDLLLLAAIPPQTPAGTLHIPGPLDSFRRMAAISSQTSPEELLPALSRNVVTLGYHFSQRLNKTTPTEYLILLSRYLDQARELEKMAGSDGLIRVPSCEAAAPLLKVLGYKLRKGCGPNAVLETEESDRAFVTVDSGFPLAEMEGAFRAGRPFAHTVRGVDIPVLFGPEAWFEKDKDPLDQILEDRSLARLYYAMSRLDSHVAAALRQPPGLARLHDLAPTLDFYGGSFSLQKDARVLLAGGPERMPQWARLVGTDPAKPAQFFFALVEKDDGWLAAYADSLTYLDARQQAYFFSGQRLERFYRALRGQSTKPGPARPIFRPTAELVLLPARLRVGNDGLPLIPGGLGTWRALFQQSVPKNARGSARQAGQFNGPDDVVEAMFARVRLFEENGLLNIFLAINEVDRRRARQLEPNTVLALAHEYSRFSHHYSLFADWPEIDDAGIQKFLKVCGGLAKIRSPLVKADALGMFQASVGLWEILARQGEIPESALGSSFDALLSRFGAVEKPPALFDAGRGALEGLLAAAGAKAQAAPDVSAEPEARAKSRLAPSATAAPIVEGAANMAPAKAAPCIGSACGGVQETVIGLLAGPPANDEASRQAREYVLLQIRSALEAQRLISLDTLFGLGDALSRSGQYSRPAVLRMAGQLREFRLPSPFVSAVEKNAAFPGYWTERHLDQMRDVDLGQVVEKRQRGLLVPFLRDTLVGLNYAYYAPPGAQVIYHNALFVRSHDFLGRNGTGTGNEIWGPSKISGTGWPLSGGGRLVGSLSGLPYGLAEAEQDFLVPQHTQALIWSDLAPQMLVAAVIPRWWQATPRQQRWVALHQRFGEDLLAEAVADAAPRERILSLLHSRIEPRRRELIGRALSEGRLDAALHLLMPAELYRLSRAAWSEGKGETWDSLARLSPAGEAIAALARTAPQELEESRISRLFGVPHPKLARSWRPELLGLAPLPALQGYSSRLMAESWESSNLYWARLADEMGLPPVSLHWLVPQLTRRLIENIFANHHEDWPAVLRAMDSTAEEYRRQAPSAAAASPAEQ